MQKFYEALEPGGYLFLGHSESISKMPVKFQAIVLGDCILYRKPTRGRVAEGGIGGGGTRVSMPDREAVELFLQEASEHLQYLREYVGVLQEVSPRHEDMERLYIAAHTLKGTSASYGFPRFSEVAGKLAHVFQYALNAPLGDDLHGPLTEFLSDGISLLETSLMEISDTGEENVEDVAAFKERYRFAFPLDPPPLNAFAPNRNMNGGRRSQHSSVEDASTSGSGTHRV